MKKITLLFAMLLVTFLGKAQVVASQNFDTALGWTSTTVTNDSGTTVSAWARRTTGGAPSCSPYAGAGMVRFNSYNIPSGSTGRLTSPAITFAGATYRVKFKMYRDSGYPTDADNVKLYYNTTNAAGGTLLGTVNRSKDLAPIVSSDGWYNYTFNISGTLTGTGYVNLLGTSAYGNNIFIDEIVVEQIPNLDAEMNAFNINSIVPSGNTQISGVIKNSGLTAITSLDVNWQVDSGTVYTQSLTGLTIDPGTVYNFTHNSVWNATPGLYSVKVWVSNINNGSVDADATNDQITKSVSVASNATTRFPLYEKFSSSTCNPCGTFNGTYFNPFLTNHSSEFALISYQVNWPSTGDPYYTAEVGTRVSYYGVSAAPTLFVDSKDGTNFSIPDLETDLTAAEAVPAYFSIDATKSMTGNDITVQVNTTPYITGDYKIHVAVVEKMTTGNATTNGETEFHNVMMKMLPDANGTAVSFVHDVPTSNTFQATLTGLHIEDMTDLDVVVFIQNATTKAIMQAKVATEALATHQVVGETKYKIYPNPSTGIIKIQTEVPVAIQIVDVTGKVVYVANQVQNESQINLTSLEKGVYIAKMKGENGIEESQKIIIK
ncbi:T9SS type A sorting domain-containing protein [Flavobacterium aciduliphilum]|uniref:Putative secreted protein (Por secretion system target) n=1 Tax=Flavobacterium aciduliphilum TaxID=1101402 RepID=A0A328YCK8_9FLAO|nr:T9SS type A sorting domain-containing protein [Flavobacterium aciduliphilum]RAR71728.1 putative secreted protein (Por secretion system target) [Flavobacterium aciduliphilum]